MNAAVFFVCVVAAESWSCDDGAAIKSNVNQSSEKVTQYELTLSAPCAGPSGPVGASAQDLTEDEEAETVDEDAVDDTATEDDDDEAEVEDDENTELVSRWDAESLGFFFFPLFI